VSIRAYLVWRLALLVLVLVGISVILNLAIGEFPSSVAVGDFNRA
jgi:hypothetical protein